MVDVRCNVRGNYMGGDDGNMKEVDGKRCGRVGGNYTVLERKG